MVLPHVNEEPLPSFELDEPLDDEAPTSVDPSEVVKTRHRPRYALPEASVSESHVRARPPSMPSSLPPPNPPKRTLPPPESRSAIRPARVEEPALLELPKIAAARAVEIPENLAALANALETYSFSSEGQTRAPSEIEIDVVVETEPVKVEPRDFDAALKAAGWKPVPRDAFASPAVRIDQPFAKLPKLNEAPSTIPPRSSLSMQVISIPPQPVPSLPVPSPVDLAAEYEILVEHKGRRGRRWARSFVVLVAVLAAASALLLIPDVTGEWIETVRAPLRAPLHDLGIDLPKP